MICSGEPVQLAVPALLVTAVQAPAAAGSSTCLKDDRLTTDRPPGDVGGQDRRVPDAQRQSEPSSDTGRWRRLVAAFVIVTVRTTGVAGAKLALPGWLAVTVQVPAPDAASVGAAAYRSPRTARTRRS